MFVSLPLNISQHVNCLALILLKCQIGFLTLDCKTLRSVIGIFQFLGGVLKIFLLGFFYTQRYYLVAGVDMILILYVRVKPKSTPLVDIW